MSAPSSLRLIVPVLAAAIVLTALGGALGLTLWHEPPGLEPAASRQLAAGSGNAGAERLESLVPETQPMAEQPTGGTRRPVKEFGRGGPGITPSPPRVLAIAPAAVPARTRHALSALPHVEKVLTVDAGVITIAGTRLNLLAVDPVDFRSWTPKAVADEPAVWSALERGELVADPGAVRRFGLILGAEYQVDAGPRLRVAASATLGLSGIDGLVSTTAGQSLGLAADVVVLLHGKEGKIGTGEVGRVLGQGAQVVSLEPRRTEAPPAQEVTVGRPGSYLELYKAAATRCPGLSWTVLAAIGQVESSHGRNNGPSSAGALGPMQFMPRTWKHYGVDGDGDGVKDIWSPYDAVPGAANYLCATGAPGNLRKAVYAYNHSWSYVDKVLNLAAAYARDYA
ncbi:lytic murein transglycosylase [Nonomuraea sp. NPDC050310]|uniref:lytic transglycosylase domain-containing protein n=1 Tax=unclassified Nonomuraea TaxID=2593643 RepID=UPI0033D624EC